MKRCLIVSGMLVMLAPAAAGVQNDYGLERTLTLPSARVSAQGFTLRGSAGQAAIGRAAADGYVLIGGVYAQAVQSRVDQLFQNSFEAIQP